jgi:hypothetical protein
MKVRRLPDGVSVYISPAGICFESDREIAGSRFLGRLFKADELGWIFGSIYIDDPVIERDVSNVFPFIYRALNDAVDMENAVNGPQLMVEA